MIEKEANKLLKSCFSSAGIDNNYVNNRLSARFSWAPPIYPLAKDYKPDFPDCKVRVVQPVSGSAVEKLDYLVSRILSQLTSHLSYPVPSSRSFIKTHLAPFSSSPSLSTAPSAIPNHHLHQVSMVGLRLNVPYTAH